MQTLIASGRSFCIGILIVVTISFAAQVKLALASERIKGDTIDLLGVAEGIKGEIVQIVVPLPNGKSSLGSGFWVHQSGYVATCWHVVRANPEATFRVQSAIDPLFDLKKNIRVFANWHPYSAKMVAKDEINDLALLKIVGPSPFLSAKSGTHIKIGDKELTTHCRLSVLKAELPEPGQRILLAGYPLGRPYRIVQEGIVASVVYGLPEFGQTFKILISTVANPGNSGGPVLDNDGKVIGVLEGGLSSRPGLDPAKAVSGIAVVVPAYFLEQLMGTLPDK
jgi:S1-C subfamily serine protease